MTTDEGVQIVCQGVHGSISKYYLEAPLYPYLRDLLSFGLPPLPSHEMSDIRTDQKEKCNLILQIAASLDVQSKLNMLEKFTSMIVPQAKQELCGRQLLTEKNPPPSPLITEHGSPYCGWPTAPEFSSEDPFLPPFPAKEESS